MEAASDLEKCDFGKIVNEDCHKNHFTSRVGLQQLEECNGNEGEVYCWRAGIDPTDMGNRPSKICYHHAWKLGIAFEKKHWQRCDLFQIHKKRVKGGHKISFDLACKLQQKSFNCVPGWQLCRNCYRRVMPCMTREETMVVSDNNDFSKVPESDIDIGAVEAAVHKTESRENLNKSLESLDESPIKTHSFPKHRRVTYAKKKLSSVVNNLKSSFATAIGVEESLFAVNEPPTSVDSNDTIKARDLDALTEQIKEKLATASFQQKVQLLTLAPESWTIKYAAEYFQVSEYLVKRAQELKKQKGILAMPDKKKGKVMSGDIINQVAAFFEDDEYSLIMPGKKDFLSISRDTHKQKRLLLCNLKELYTAFKSLHPYTRISFSKFCSLRPKWCVTVGSSGSHSVCVCAIHQNAILLVEASGIDKTYKELMSMVVCSLEYGTCMARRCPNCPKVDPLKAFLVDSLFHSNEEIVFQQWLFTDSTQLVTQSLPVDEFIELLVDKIDNLTKHSYTAKCQSQYLKQLKESLGNESVTVLGDFAENYAFVVQDEVQSFHWSKMYCTVHPVVIYYRDGDALQHRSFCFISDDLDHDTNFVYQMPKELMQVVIAEFPNVKTLEYFSDGCAGQYKNFKNLINLTLHHQDFGLDASWTFFATSHGKSPCDGIGGTVKRLTARASLQRSTFQQILTARDMFNFCCQIIEGIDFHFISKETMVKSTNRRKT